MHRKPAEADLGECVYPDADYRRRGVGHIPQRAGVGVRQQEQRLPANDVGNAHQQEPGTSKERRSHRHQRSLGQSCLVAAPCREPQDDHRKATGHMADS